MKNYKQELNKKTDFIFNMNRETYPANLIKDDILNMLIELSSYKTLTNYLIKDKTGEEYKKIKNPQLDEKANMLNIFSFFLKIVIENNQNIETFQQLFITQYLLAKRIEDLEELILNLQDIINNEKLNNKEKIESCKIILEKPIENYNNYSQNIFPLLEIIFKENQEELLKEINKNQNDLDLIKDLDDEVNMFSKKIQIKKSITELNKIEKINLEDIKKSSLIKEINQKEILENLKEIFEIIKENKEYENIILEQYKCEYIGLSLSKKILELENLLQDYLIIINNL